MAGFSALGVGSGLPLDEMVTQLVKVERDVKLGRVDSQKRRLDASLSAFGKIKSSLSAFQDAIKKLSGNQLTQRGVSITQPVENQLFLEASARNNAPVSDFNVKVNQLAAGSRFESADGLYASPNEVIANSDGVLSFTADGKSFDVEVTTGMTLNQLRQAVNNAAENFGVNANIVNAGGAVGSKLIFSSSITGDGNDLVISSNNSELDSFATVAAGGGAGGLAATQTAQNAIIEIDGIIAQSASNEFNNVIQDITLTARKVTPEDTSARVQVNTDREQVEENIKAFIKTYNALVDEIAKLTKPRVVSEDGRSVTGQGGNLNGDSTVRSVMGQLTSILGGSVAEAESTMNTLFSIGITFDEDGRLEINSSNRFGGASGQERFDAALDDMDSLVKLFSGEGGLATRLEQAVESLNDRNGILSVREKSIREQLDRNTNERERVTRYLEGFEKTLRNRFVTLDSLLGRMNATANFVSSQMANLPSFNTKK